MPIRVYGLDQLIKRLEFLPAFQRGIEAGTVYVKAVIADYPEVRRGKQPFKTDKQRRFFFWALKAGILEVPYRRGITATSQTLGRKWTTAFENNKKRGIVGNNVSYGPLVQDETQQTAYHRQTGWRTVQDVAQKEAYSVRNFVQKEIERMINS